MSSKNLFFRLVPSSLDTRDIPVPAHRGCSRRSVRLRPARTRNAAETVNEGRIARFRHSAWRLIGAGLVALATTTAAAAAELKIGYVNAAQVVEEAPQGDAALKKLEAEFGPRDRELVALRDEIRELEEGLERDKLIISDSDRLEQENQLRRLRRRFQRESQEFREDYNLRRNEELAELQKVVYKAIVELAKEEDYDLILHEGAVYAGDKIDITDKVLDKLETQ